MKEIDYITKNIDVKKFLKLIKKKGDTFLIEEIFDSVKNPNNKIRELLQQYVFSGLFFNRVKKLSLTYYAWIDSGNERVDPEFSIICFYSDTDKKYRLLSFENTGGNFLEQEYRLVKIFNKKPTEQQIEIEFEERMKKFNQLKAKALGVDFLEDYLKCQFLIEDGKFLVALHTDTEEVYLDELMLERGKSISKIHSKAKEKALRLVQKDGYELENLPVNFKKDKDIVLESIDESGGHTLEYADDSLMKDREIILRAVGCLPEALQHADKILKKDRKFILEAVKRNWGLLEFVDKSFKKDKEIVLEAVKQIGFALEFADKSLRKDKEIVLVALKSNVAHYAKHSLVDDVYPDGADESLRNDPDILTILNKKKK